MVMQLTKAMCGEFVHTQSQTHTPLINMFVIAM